MLEKVQQISSGIGHWLVHRFIDAIGHSVLAPRFEIVEWFASLAAVNPGLRGM
jgi:hypothetical protein